MHAGLGTLTLENGKGKFMKETHRFSKALSTSDPGIFAETIM